MLVYTLYLVGGRWVGRGQEVATYLKNSLEDHTSAVYMLTSHPVVMSWSCGDDVPGVMWAGCVQWWATCEDLIYSVVGLWWCASSFEQKE